MINIGVTGTGSLIGQAILKSIKYSEFKEIYKLVGFDYFKNTVGSFWCDENFILPDILDENSKGDWLKCLINIIINKEIKVLFPGVDFELELLSKNREKIKQETGCDVVVSSENVIRIGNDKYLTFKFLKENKLHYPKTYLPLEFNNSLLTFPVIVKPRVGARSIGVSKVNTPEEINDILDNTNSPIIQELVGDGETEFTCGVIAFNGDIKHIIALKRSLKDGNTFISEYRKDFSQQIYKYINDISRKLNIYGACNFQLRIDRNGIPKLFEINPRHSGTTYIRSLFGYNEIIYILHYIINGEEKDFILKEGKVMRYFEEVIIE
jgi:carbamoyl-phosphate synthase large subunit